MYYALPKPNHRIVLRFRESTVVSCPAPGAAGVFQFYQIRDVVLNAISGRPAYRSELDGLRAIAVLAVILYHAGLNWNGMALLPGGFLGVDVFFVLSGFLITGILVQRQPGLMAYYKSRVDRIYPALLLMLLFSCIAAYWFMTTSDLLSFVESLKGALGFYSNYVFMHEDSYAADSSNYKVLLHTWSLGVEWQYYLIFPFIIYAARRFFDAQFEQILIGLFAVSFFYCLYLMKIDSTYAFYSTPSRVWQLFAGGIVFLISRHLKESRFDTFLSALGLVVIAYAMLFFKDSDNHPGFISFSAVIGSSLFILFTRPGTLIYKLTTLRIAGFLGVISYSLYLYHQPILVFYRLGFGEIGKKSFILLFILMILVAYLSYRFFEDPIRRSRKNYKYLIIATMMILVWSFANGAKNTEGYANRQSEEAKIALTHFEVIEWDRLRSDVPGINFKGDDYLICNRRVPSTACHFGEGQPDVVLLGDSFAGVFAYSLSRHTDTYSMTMLHYSACPLVIDPIWFNDRYKECWEINKQRWVELEKLGPAVIVIGTNFNQFYQAKMSLDEYKYGEENSTTPMPSEQVYRSFAGAVQKLVDMGHKPVILLQPPKPTIDVKKELVRRVSSGVLRFDREYGAKASGAIDEEVREALRGIEGVSLIDLKEKMCIEGDKCLIFNEDGGLYNNGQHLSYFGAQLFMEDILKLIEAKRVELQ